MNMTRALFIGGAALVALAYVAGYWPQHRRLIQAEAQNQTLSTQLDSARARVRLAEVLGLALRLSDAIAVRNFGEAATLSSAYFDRVREEARIQTPDARRTLDRILQSRDHVTAALARTDPSAGAALSEQHLALRQALGYPTAPQPTSGPTK
jgi:hypothetical protein